MYQKDYVLFLIEQFARVLQRILAKILGGSYDEADFQIEQVYRQYLGLNSDLIHAFSYRYLMQMQNVDPEHYVDRCVVLAELLRMDSLLFRRRGQLRPAFLRGLKSLQVFLELYREFPGKMAQHAPTMKGLYQGLVEILSEAGAADNAISGNAEVPDEVVRAVEALPEGEAAHGEAEAGTTDPDSELEAQR